MYSSMGVWTAPSPSHGHLFALTSPWVPGGSNVPLQSRFFLMSIGSRTSLPVAGCLSSILTPLAPCGCPASNSSAASTVAPRRSSGGWPPMRGRTRMRCSCPLPSNRQLRHALSSRFCRPWWKAMRSFLRPCAIRLTHNVSRAKSTPSSMRLTLLLGTLRLVFCSRSVSVSGVRPSFLSRGSGLLKAVGSSRTALSAAQPRPGPGLSLCASGTSPMGRPLALRTPSQVRRAHAVIRPPIMLA